MGLGEEIEKDLHYSCPAAMQLLNNDWELQYERSSSGGGGHWVGGAWELSPRGGARGTAKASSLLGRSGRIPAIHLQEPESTL